MTRLDSLRQRTLAGAIMVAHEAHERRVRAIRRREWIMRAVLLAALLGPAALVLLAKWMLP